MTLIVCIPTIVSVVETNKETDMHIKAQIEQVKKEIQGVQFQLDNDAHLSNTEVNKLDIKMAFLIGTLNLLISALYAPSIVRTENGTHLVKEGRIYV